MNMKEISFLITERRPVPGSNSDTAGLQDGLLWYKDSGRHLDGEFSMAEYIMIMVGQRQHDTSIIISFSILRVGFTAEQNFMSVDVMQKAFQAIEEGNLSLVAKHWPTNPQMTAVGSCCLVSVYGMSCKGNWGRLDLQLSNEHNTSLESVRWELHSIHPDHSHIVVLKHNVWPVKGLIQVSFVIIWKLRLLVPHHLPKSFCCQHEKNYVWPFSHVESVSLDLSVVTELRRY
ncbi:hypothetical protein Pfo_008057 [Paulownia fortunei]|nr:hypothetical protein Pfo_008057 [Paulownia fortunei]